MSRCGPSATRLAAFLLVVAAGVACGRGAPRVAVTPTPRDTTAQRARPESTPRIDTMAAAAARRDSLARDSAARAAADSTRPGQTPRRRTSQDPTSRCRAVAFENTPTTRLQSYTDQLNKYITFLGGGVIARCEGIDNRLRADSAESYESTGQLILVNNVSYDEPNRVRLTSNRLTYFRSDERLVAEGNVNVTLPSGTTLVGPRAEYYRAVPGLRTGSRLAADGRPTLRVIGRPAPRPGADTARRAPTQPDTATIIANLIVDENDSLVFASGQVQVLRTDVSATSDSATFDQGTETARLLRNAQIRGQQGRPFTLSGALIDLFSRDRQLSRVISRGDAHVVSNELDLKSDTVDLRVRENRVERAYAWGPSRATATSPEQDVVADSIEAILPAQRIRELHAVRRAVARSLPDSTKITTKERDMLAGDTIVARFDTLAAQRDTTRNPPVRQIVATGHASSVYQIPGNGGRRDRPGINYVKGRLITVGFDSGQVQTVTVTDSATGVYLDPSDSTKADSTPKRPRRTTTPQPGARGTRPGSVIPGRRPDDSDESGGAMESRTALVPPTDARGRAGLRRVTRGAP